MLLVARDRRGSALTEAGAAFLPAARRTLAQADEAAAVARAVARGDAGRLRAGIAPTAASGPALTALAALRSDAPAIEVSVRELRQGELVLALLGGEVDVAVMAVLAPPPLDRKIRWRNLSAEGFVAALPLVHPHASRSTLPLAALADDPFVTFARDQGERYHDALEGLCRAAGFTPRSEEAVYEVPTQLALVAAGLGVALVPESTRFLRSGDVAYVSLREPTPTLTTVLAWREHGDTPAVTRLLSRLP